MKLKGLYLHLDVQADLDLLAQALRLRQEDVIRQWNDGQIENTIRTHWLDVLWELRKSGAVSTDILGIRVGGHYSG